MHILRSQPFVRFLCRCVLLLMMLLPLASASAQRPCKLKPVKVKGALAGKVFLIREGESERQPLSGVAIDILDTKERRLVSSASSMEDGGYLVKGLERGLYIIKTTHMIAADLEVEVEISPSEKEGTDRLVNIILGMDKDKECGGGRVETEKVK